jgi:hypothetical protein
MPRSIRFWRVSALPRSVGFAPSRAALAPSLAESAWHDGLNTADDPRQSDPRQQTASYAFRTGPSPSPGHSWSGSRYGRRPTRNETRAGRRARPSRGCSRVWPSRGNLAASGQARSLPVDPLQRVARDVLRIHRIEGLLLQCTSDLRGVGRNAGARARHVHA